MARINKVELKGIVSGAPVYMERDGQYYARFKLMTCMGTRKTGNPFADDKMLKEKPTIITRNKELAQSIAKLKENDIVDIRGTLSTAGNIKKASICPQCRAKNVAQGVMTFVTPIYMEKTGSVKDMDEGVQYLANIRGISNTVTAFGRVAKEPEMIRTATGIKVTQFQFALIRGFYREDDDIEARVDYPWVKSYGSNAQTDRYRLKVGTLALIDGTLQSRNVTRHGKCSECGCAYDWKDESIEIVPYSTEYLVNFRNDDEVAELQGTQKQDMENTLKTIFDDDVTDEEVKESFMAR